MINLLPFEAADRTGFQRIAHPVSVALRSILLGTTRLTG